MKIDIFDVCVCVDGWKEAKKKTKQRKLPIYRCFFVFEFFVKNFFSLFCHVVYR